MAATKVGIIYSIAQRRRREVMIPDDDAQLPWRARKSGEAYVEQPMADYLKTGPDAAVLTASGGAPLSHRCAVIDPAAGGLVVHHVCADPAIDSFTNHTLVQSDISAVGDTYASGVFTRQIAQISSLGVVTAIAGHDISKPIIATNAGGFVMAAGKLTVGAQVSVPSSTISAARSGSIAAS